MKKFKLVTITSVMLIVGLVALDYNNSRIEHINDQLASNPPAAGSSHTFGAINSSRNNSNGATAGFKTTTSTTAVYKVKKGNVTSYSDKPSNNLIASNDTAEVIEVITSTPPSTTNPSGDKQVKHSQWESQFAMFPQDQDGWSIITPSVDSRMIYVSSSDGNDSKAKAYFSKDIPDPRNPPSNIVAFKTIAEALKLQRDGHPDWVLLKKGDEWQIDKAMFLVSGKSSEAPLVITSYGNSTQRPLIKTGVQIGIYLMRSRSFIAVTGIEFYANYRDPTNLANFVGWSLVGTPGGFVSVSADTKEVESILLEDNVFNFYSGGAQLNGSSKHKNITVRRNQFLNSYSTTSHSQGMFAYDGSILIEDNLFDHNGWYQQNLNSNAEGQATMFNHNAYLGNMTDTVIVNNIFSRSSSIGLKLTSNPNKEMATNTIKSKNILVDNNLFIEGEVGISAGGNDDFNNGYRWQNMAITNNVFVNIGKGQPTNRTLAWYIEAIDWDGGVISGNYLLCNSNPSVNNVWGIGIEGLIRDVSVFDNIIYGIKGSKDKMITTSTKEKQTGLLFKDNAVSNDASCSSATFADDSYIHRFIDNAKKQSASNWDDAYTASGFNKIVKTSITK